MVAVARTFGWSLGSALVALIFGIWGSHGTIVCLEAGAGFAAAGALVSSVTLNGFWSKLSIIEHLISVLPMVVTAGDRLRAREPIPRLPLRRS